MRDRGPDDVRPPGSEPPIDRPVDRPIDRPIDRPVDRPIDRPIDRREAAQETPRTDERGGEEPPPFGGSWTVLYALVLLNLLALILLFYAFTRAFS
jgi:hypothetical protein